MILDWTEPNPATTLDLRLNELVLAEPPEVWVCFWQSNFEGNDEGGNIDRDGFEAPHPRLFQYTRGIQNTGYEDDEVEGTVVQAEAPLQFPEIGSHLTTISPAFHFGKELCRRRPGKRIILLPVAVGGHGFKPDGVVGNTVTGLLPTVLDQATPTQLIQGDQYSRMVNETNALIDAGAVLGGFVGIGSESEVIFYTDTVGQPASRNRGQNFQVWLRLFIRRLRNAIKRDQYGGHLHKPFVFGTISESWRKGIANGDAINTALKGIESLEPFTAVVDLDGVQGLNLTDAAFIHWNTASLREIGPKLVAGITRAENNSNAVQAGPVAKVFGGATAPIEFASSKMTVGSGVSVLSHPNYLNLFRLNGVQGQGVIDLEHGSVGVDLLDFNNFTIIAICKFDPASGSRQIVSSKTTDFVFSRTGANIQIGTAPTYNDIVGTATILDGVFYHVAMTYDRDESANGTIKHYVNGAPDGSANAATAITSRINLQIGEWNDSALAPNFDGDMAGVWVFNRELDADEILLHYLENYLALT